MSKKRHMLLYLPVILALCWLVLLAWVYISALFARNVTLNEIQPADAVLVLGNAVYRNGEPNPCLRSRVTAAVELYNAGKAPKLVVSGGTDSDGSNEAAHMKEIAMELGVPEFRIVTEGKSENTYENIFFSTIPLTNNQSVIIVSADYHLKRAVWLGGKIWKDKKTIQAYSGQDTCDRNSGGYSRKLVRESLAWVKAVITPE
ncbi:YdcF family protein [Neisseria montereyensis]|uniref:YdcF family protein n=1 Tax=Neisseria montereyensis TaxID=2973938 RepID=A0ABT2FBY3_9NEIS|nr:YdcF family protein [Neisseria montereyensis]MCS4533249.1 YdcF family protein [Neisseria montereyensis]